MGLELSPGKLVRRLALPPDRSTIQILPAYANAMLRADTLGERSILVCASMEAGVATARHATAKAIWRVGSMRRNVGMIARRGIRVYLGATRSDRFGNRDAPSKAVQPITKLSAEEFHECSCCA